MQCARAARRWRVPCLTWMFLNQSKGPYSGSSLPASWAREGWLKAHSRRSAQHVRSRKGRALPVPRVPLRCDMVWAEGVRGAQRNGGGNGDWVGILEGSSSYWDVAKGGAHIWRPVPLSLLASVCQSSAPCSRQYSTCFCSGREAGAGTTATSQLTHAPTHAQCELTDKRGRRARPCQPSKPEGRRIAHTSARDTQAVASTQPEPDSITCLTQSRTLPPCARISSTGPTLSSAPHNHSLVALPLVNQPRGSKMPSAFVYGTLMANEVLSKLLQRVPPSVPATLHGFSRHRVKNVVYPAIIPSSADRSVQGRVSHAR